MNQQQLQVDVRPSRHPIFRFLRKEWLGCLILVAGLSISYAIWSISIRNHEDIEKARFISTGELISTSLARRMNSNEQILRGGAALFNMNNNTSREQWRTYVSSLRIDETSPGMQGVGFILRVVDKDKAQHTAKIRAEGHPEYTIHPATHRDEYLTAVYIEPFWGRNLHAFGYDLASESVRRAALDLARDTGEPSLTGRVKLVQEGKEGNQAGFLMFCQFINMTYPEVLLRNVVNPYSVMCIARSVQRT